MTTLLTNARLIGPNAETDTLEAVLIEDGVIARKSLADVLTKNIRVERAHRTMGVMV